LIESPLRNGFNGSRLLRGLGRGLGRSRSRRRRSGDQEQVFVVREFAGERVADVFGNGVGRERFGERQEDLIEVRSGESKGLVGLVVRHVELAVAARSLAENVVELLFESGFELLVFEDRDKAFGQLGADRLVVFVLGVGENGDRARDDLREGIFAADLIDEGLGRRRRRGRVVGAAVVVVVVVEDVVVLVAEAELVVALLALLALLSPPPHAT